MAELLQFPGKFVTTAQATNATRLDRANGPTPPIADAAARAAALDTHVSCVVEAPAGSGKTGLLTQRFLKLLADPATAQPEEVLAMTFTRKATAEMKERIFEQLQAAASDTPLTPRATAFELETRSFAQAALARSAQLGWELLAQPQRLNIRSILSVCMDLANALPLLSGSGGRQQPVEDARALYALAARRTLMQLGSTKAHAPLNLSSSSEAKDLLLASASQEALKGTGSSPSINPPETDGASSPEGSPLHHALRTLLLHRDANLQDAERLLAEMLAAREQWAELVPLTPGQLDDDALDLEVRPRLERTLETVVCAGLTRALRTLPAGVLEDLATFARRLAHEPGYKDAPSPIALCADKHLPPEAVAEHLEHWTTLIDLLLTKGGDWRKGFAVNHLGFALPKADKARLQQLIAEIQTEPLQHALCAVRDLPPARYPDEQWRVARALFHVLRHALAELKLLFNERNQCDFNELALGAREALAGDAPPSQDDPDERATDLALSAGGRLRHLLVDEMQDTSSSQYELIRALTQSWDGHSQTLFLVGDPKQSIYLFRQARVERFLRTLHQARLGEIPLQPLRLTANFRSQAALVEDFNTTFGGTETCRGIFPQLARSSSLSSSLVVEQNQSDPNTLEVPFVEAIAIRPATSNIGLVWHPRILSTAPDAAPFDHATHEARTIRNLIEARLALPLPPGRTRPWSIAVLGRTRDHLSTIVQEFKAHNGKPEVPFRAVDLDPLGELPEVLDALALTRALLHPADRIAWLAVLRAPWCGLSLADLLTLTSDGATRHPEAAPEATIAELVHQRASLLSAEGQQLLARAWPVLEAATTTTGRTPLSVHVDRTWRSLGGDAALQPEQRTNVRRFLAILRALEADAGRIDLRVLAARLRGLYAGPRSGDAQVELMTMHKAKGLEWDLVLLPGLHRTPRTSYGVLLNWLELDGESSGEEASILLAPIHGKGAESDSLNSWLAGDRSRRERAEEKRLFYVAVTRAREQVHLFAALPERSGVLVQPAAGSLLKAAWPAAEQHFAAVSQPTPSLVDDLLQSLHEPDWDYDAGLAIAASAESAEAHVARYPIIQRLPAGFTPSARFSTLSGLASTPPQPSAFDRPDGSFAVRAFGNVVHRYLQLLATRLLTLDGNELLLQVNQWQPRLEASLRGEGVAPSTATRESARALLALQNTLNDPIGRWLLSPHPEAASESALNLPQSGSLRVDRTFLAGPHLLSTGDSHIWIVDFKTTALNDRANDAFEAAERSKYTAQLEAYAALRRSLPGTTQPIRLGLYYPLIPRLLDWLSSPQIP